MPDLEYDVFLSLNHAETPSVLAASARANKDGAEKPLCRKALTVS
jgi:hypothetical protein